MRSVWLHGLGLVRWKVGLGELVALLGQSAAFCCASAVSVGRFAWASGSLCVWLFRSPERPSFALSAGVRCVVSDGWMRAFLGPRLLSACLLVTWCAWGRVGVWEKGWAGGQAC